MKRVLFEYIYFLFKVCFDALRDSLKRTPKAAAGMGDQHNTASNLRF